MYLQVGSAVRAAGRPAPMSIYAFVIAVHGAAVYSSYRVASLVALSRAVILVGASGNAVTHRSSPTSTSPC